MAFIIDKDGNYIPVLGTVSVNGGGIIQKFEGSTSYSSVTNIANVTANAISSNGIIMGNFN